jgi:alpha-beta hydrolase superfamily lysophospholipase
MARHDEGFFSAKDGLRLFWESDVPEVAPQAVVALVHGFGDHLGRYRALRDALLAQGYAVHAFDFRGHGKSHGKRGHVDDFADYLEDLKRFFGRVREAHPASPRFVLAHSMGGLVTLQLAVREGLAGFNGVILSSPFLGLAFAPPPVKLLAAKVLNRLLPSLTMGNELKFEQLSRDTAWQESTRRDPLYGRVVSSRWFVESQKAQAEVLRSGEKLTAPICMLCGGSDPIAATPIARRFFESVGSKDKLFKEYPEMRHEILNELGKEEVFQDIVRWTSTHL